MPNLKDTDVPGSSVTARANSPAGERAVSLVVSPTRSRPSHSTVTFSKTIPVVAAAETILTRPRTFRPSTRPTSRRVSRRRRRSNPTRTVSAERPPPIPRSRSSTSTRTREWDARPTPRTRPSPVSPLASRRTWRPRAETRQRLSRHVDAHPSRRRDRRARARARAISSPNERPRGVSRCAIEREEDDGARRGGRRGTNDARRDEE